MQIKLIQQTAWSFHRTTGMDYEELFAEASLAYVQAMKYFDPNKSNEVTYAWNCMRNWLVDYQLREWAKNEEYATIELGTLPFLEIDLPRVGMALEFKDALFSRLKKDAKKICEIVFTNNINSRTDLREKLRQDGWSWARIWRSFKEIKIALNEIG